MFDTHSEFNTAIKPLKPKWYIRVAECGGMAYYFATGIKLRKHNMKGLKPPYIVLSNHASLADFPIAMAAVFPYATSWLVSIEEFVHREWLLRNGGCTYKRKFTADPIVVKHLFEIIKRQKGILTMYPEARFSLAGINEQLDDALGSFVKHCGCPVVIGIEKGSFLRCPQWNKKPERRVTIEADFTQIVTREEAATLSAAEIQKRIEDSFIYDDYAWQRDNKIKIKSKKRAHNIHRILYKCPCCNEEFQMRGEDTKIKCLSCGAEWEMDEYGVLHRIGGEDIFTHVPDWYNWERECVRKEIEDGSYHYSENARFELLKNTSEGTVPIGHGVLTHNRDGITFTGTVNGEPFEMNRSAKSMISCHIEYDFHKKGGALDFCNLSHTYFVFPESNDLRLTKLHFAVEEMHKACKQ